MTISMPKKDGIEKNPASLEVHNKYVKTHGGLQLMYLQIRGQSPKHLDLWVNAPPNLN